MAQNHCNLPWMGNLAQFPQCLKQHLQGVLCHGRILTMYRTFHNIKNTANLQLHTLLLKLEDIHNLENGLPDTVYLQIDGASENTAKVVIAMCELIVHKRLTKKLVLTRLMVGHTHCDIDGVFGRLWLYIRDRHCMTPDDYANFIKIALSKSGSYEANVRNIFVIPNYAAIFDGCLDKHFESYAKKEDTQHQFIFEAVEADKFFPLGVKTTYRAYSSDEVIELTDKKYDNNEEESQDLDCDILQLYPRKVIVKTFPEATDQDPGGMYVLQQLPSVKSILPQGFIAGSRKAFEKTMQFIQSKFEKNAPDVVTSWKEFSKLVPTSDDADQYLAENPGALHIPFHELLFNGILVNGEGIAIKPVTVASKKKHSLPLVRSSDSINWSRRGKTFKDGDPNINKTRVGLHVPPAKFVIGAACNRAKRAEKQRCQRNVKSVCRQSKERSDDEYFDIHYGESEKQNQSSDLHVVCVVGKKRRRRSQAHHTSIIDSDSSEDEAGSLHEDHAQQQQQSANSHVRCSSIIYSESEVESENLPKDNDCLAIDQPQPVTRTSFVDDVITTVNSSDDEMGYVTDTSKTDGNNFVQRSRKFIVPKFGNTKVYIGRCFQFSKLEGITIIKFHPREFLIQHWYLIIGIVTLKTDAEESLYFKIISIFQEEELLFYIPSVNLMAMNSFKKTKFNITWKGANPTNLSFSLVGRKVRKEFEMEDLTKRFFVGTVTELKSTRRYVVKFDDGDVIFMDEKDVLVALLPFSTYCSIRNRRRAASTENFIASSCTYEVEPPMQQETKINGGAAGCPSSLLNSSNAPSTSSACANALEVEKMAGDL